MNRELFGNPNENYDTFHFHVQDLKNKHLPYKLVKFNKYKHKGSNWISRGVINSIKYRDEIYRKLKKTEKSSVLHDEVKQKLKVYNSILKKTIRESKLSHYNKAFDDNKSNMRKTWAIINELICKTKNKHQGIKTILSSEGKQIKDQVKIAELLNNFYLNIGPALANHAVNQPNINFQTFLKRRILTSFHFDLIDECSLGKTIRNLRSRSSSGHDGIST